MQLKTPSGLLYIDDNSIKARKIKKGHAHSFVDGELVVESTPTKLDTDHMLEQLKKKKANNKEIQNILLVLLEEHLKNGRI